MLTVTAATLQSIAVTPANPSIAKGATQQFTATGTYSDGTTQNLTSTVTWSSATTTIATISAAGLATGAGVGTSTITATSGAISGSTVADGDGGDATVDRGDAGEPIDRQGRDPAVHGDGDVQRRLDAEPDEHGNWSSGTTTAATISPAGLATGAGAGTSTITATSGGDQRLDDADRDGGDVAVDRGDAGEPIDREGRDAAVHGDGDVQRQLDAEPDERA